MIEKLDRTQSTAKQYKELTKKTQTMGETLYHQQ